MGFEVIMVVVSTIDEGVGKKKKFEIQIMLNFVVIQVSLPI